ncbi:hypothetical protein [Halolamina sp.]|jgi:uncharacterized protein with PIN domain|uniref:hypothetical protein n=1 Tax=Halolamina sp. TaxID=1940283 RepID=UPI000223B54C|nr:hypothetical protein Halar_1688 [halophilic archaeon DL31]
MRCGHELDSEYRTTTDSAIVDIRGVGEELRIDIVTVCPECGQALELTLSEESRRETDIDVRLDGAEMAGS